MKTPSLLFKFDRNIDGIVSSLPALVDGETYFLTTDNKLYFADGDAYKSSPVPLWFEVILRGTGEVYKFDGGCLEAVVSVSSVAGRVGDVLLSPADVGLSNVDNTSDGEKPVSMLQQLALDLKASCNEVNVVVANLEALKSVDTSKYRWAYRQGFLSWGDGGESFWTFSTTSTAPPNDINIVKPTVGNGRWLLNTDGEINVKVAGAGLGQDDSSKIQAIHDALEVGGTIKFPVGSYIFSGIKVNKSITIKGASQFDGGVVFTNPTPSTPFFEFKDTSSISMMGFRLTSSVDRTSGAFLSFSNTNRVKIRDFFADKYFIGLDFDGGSEITLDTFQMFDGVSGFTQPGSGAIRLGNTSYTGAINIDNAYIKCSDRSKQCSFGIQAKYVDVLNIGSGVTIIQHGSSLLINPSSNQTASLVKSFGACYDTAINGLYITPELGAKVLRCDFFGCWFGEHSTSGVTIDGNLGTVDGVNITGGEAVNCLYSGVNITGLGARNIKVSGMDIAGNGIGIRLADSSNVFVLSNNVGVTGGAVGNTTGIALGNNVSGGVQGNNFTQNITSISGAVGANLSFYQNRGLVNWLNSSRSMVSTDGTLGVSSGTLATIKECDRVTFKYTGTVISNATGAGGLIIPLTYPVVGGLVGCGRGITTGKQLQVYANGGSSCVVYNFDGSYAGGDGVVIEVSGTYQTTA